MSPLGDQIICKILRLIAVPLRAMPYSAALAIGRFAGACIFLFSSRRRVAYSDLKAALGDQFNEKERWRIVREHYEHYGQMFVEILCFPNLTRKWIDENIEVANMDRYLKTIGEDRGGILLTAHFGNWELSQIVSGILGKPIAALARDQKDKYLNEYLNELRESHGSIAVKRGIAVRELLRSLRRKELVGILGDQDAGRDQGLIMPLLGRKTTIPTGAFELAMRTGAPILPCFIHRLEGQKHAIDVFEPIEFGEDEKKSATAFKKKVSQYVECLEGLIRKYPNQWLWEAKRWKYTWTKRILILSDGKPGHVKQSEAVREKFQAIQQQYGRAGMEYPTQTIRVQFKSELRRKLFPYFSILMMPWIQGRLRTLRFFFSPETADLIEKSSADFIISAGSSLVALNLCLANDSRAKSIVLMKPSFPFNFFKYDLVIVPMHDRGIVPQREFRTLLAPNQMKPSELSKHAESLKDELKDSKKIKIGVFLGGSTRDFQMDAVTVEKIFSSLRRELRADEGYVVTTSRRTPEAISEFLKNKITTDTACQMLVVAAEDTRAGVAEGMMGLADILIVTEDSISMISEAISSGKKVIVVNLQSDRLPDKHQRFKAMIMEQADVVVADPAQLAAAIRKIERQSQPKVFEKESEAMQKQLQEIL